jgi:hypothetical protein
MFRRIFRAGNRPGDVSRFPAAGLPALASPPARTVKGSNIASCTQTFGGKRGLLLNAETERARTNEVIVGGSRTHAQQQTGNIQ